MNTKNRMDGVESKYVCTVSAADGIGKSKGV